MVKRMNSRLYLITTNDKKFENWAKQMKKKVSKKEAALDYFNSGYNDVVNGNYLARASFVCYWEIAENNNLARLAPAITQATLVHLFHRFIEAGMQEEVTVIQQIMSNYLRLLHRLEGETDEEE